MKNFMIYSTRLIYDRETCETSLKYGKVSKLVDREMGETIMQKLTRHLGCLHQPVGSDQFLAALSLIDLNNGIVVKTAQASYDTPFIVSALYQYNIEIDYDIIPILLPIERCTDENYKSAMQSVNVIHAVHCNNPLIGAEYVGCALYHKGVRIEQYFNNG